LCEEALKKGFVDVSPAKDLNVVLVFRIRFEDSESPDSDQAPSGCRTHSGFPSLRVLTGSL
jgi:hypothetical protein